MGAPSPDTQIANIRNERLAESRRASTDAVLRRLGQKTLGATTKVAATNDTEILDIGISRSKQEKNEEIKEEKKKTIQKKIEGSGGTILNEITDPVKKEHRERIRKISNNIDSNVKTKEAENNEKNKEQKAKKLELDQKVNDAMYAVSTFYDLTAALAIPGAIQPDGTIDANIIKSKPGSSGAPTGTRLAQAEAAINEWNRLSREQHRLTVVSGSKVEVSEEVESEFNNFVTELQNEGKTATTITESLRDEIIELAMKEMKSKGGYFNQRAFIEKYFLIDDPAGGGGKVLIESLRSRYRITDVTNIISGVTSNTNNGKFNRSMRELVLIIDNGGDPIDSIDKILVDNAIALTSKEAKLLRKTAEKAYLTSEDIAANGDLRRIANVNIPIKDKVYYIEAYSKFDGDTFIEDFRTLEDLAAQTKDRKLKKRLQKVMDKLTTDLANEVSDPSGSLGIDDVNAKIEEAIKAGTLSRLEGDEIKNDVLEKRQDKIFLLYMDKLSDDFIEGKYEWDKLGIDNNLTGDYTPDGLIGQLVAKGEISDEQAKAIAKYLGKGNQSAKDFVQADFALFNDYMDDVRDNAIHNIENNPMISDALKNAEIARIEALSRLNDIQNDKLKNIFDVAERAWYSNSYTFKKYARYIQWFALIAGGGAIGLSTGRPELMILFAIAGGVGGAEGFRRMSKSMEKSANIALLFSEQQVSRQRADDETRLMAYIFSEIQTNDMDPVNARIFLRAMGMDPAMLDSMTDGESVMQMQADRIAQARESIIEIRTKIKNLKAA